MNNKPERARGPIQLEFPFPYPVNLPVTKKPGRRHGLKFNSAGATATTRSST